MVNEVAPEEFRSWLTQLCGSHQRDAATIAKLRSLNSESFFVLANELLSHADQEIRCQIALAMFYVSPIGGIDFLVSMLADPEWIVRVEVCGILHDLAEKTAVPALIRIMNSDPNPMVRNTAAYALGGVGDPAAIPKLIDVLDNDHEPDELGHTASGCAKTALDDILKANQTRIQFADGLCTMQPKTVDIELLKATAMDVYRSL